MHIFGTDIDLNRNQAKNFRLENGIALPTVGASDSGLTFYHSGLSKFYGWTGSTWIDFGSGGGGGGSTTFVGLTDTPSNFTGSALKVPRVNLGETALEFYLPPIKAEDQGGGIGYAWANRNEAFYAILGANSFDLTFATSGTDYGIASTDGFSFGYTNRLPLAGNSFGGHVAFGFDNTVTGYYGNIAMGGDNTLNSGYTCMQVGYQNVGNWSNSIGMGYQFGTNNTSSAYFNVSAGSGLTNNWRGATMVGAANVIDPATSTATNRPAFTVGIGTLSTSAGSVGVPTLRKDGFMVRYNSEILAPNTTIAIIDAETTGKQLVTKEWIVDQGFSTGTGGDVYKVNTPVNNQIGIWTGDGTLEGDTALSFDTSVNRLDVGSADVNDFGWIKLWHGFGGQATLDFQTSGFGAVSIWRLYPDFGGAGDFVFLADGVQAVNIDQDTFGITLPQTTSAQITSASNKVLVTKEWITDQGFTSTTPNLQQVLDSGYFVQSPDTKTFAYLGFEQNDGFFQMKLDRFPLLYTTEVYSDTQSYTVTVDDEFGQRYLALDSTNILLRNTDKVGGTSSNTFYVTKPTTAFSATFNLTPPSTLSVGTAYTIPLSVNGVYADADAEITVPLAVTPVTWTPTGTGLNLTFNESYYIDYGTHLEMQVNGFWTASNPGAGTGSVNLPAGLTVRNRVSGKIVGTSVGNPETNVTPGAIGAKHDTVADTLLGLVMDQTYNGAMTYRFSIVIKIEV